MESNVKENPTSIIPKLLSSKEYTEISIIGDGNCFYRCLSIHIEKFQENYNYYRNLIYQYIEANKEVFKYFFEMNENETEEDYNDRYKKYIDSIKFDKTYAGDFEISSASIVLKKGIIIYRKKDNNEYEFINNFSSSNNSLVDNILVFINICRIVSQKGYNYFMSN